MGIKTITIATLKIIITIYAWLLLAALAAAFLFGLPALVALIGWGQ